MRTPSRCASPVHQGLLALLLAALAGCGDDQAGSGGAASSSASNASTATTAASTGMGGSGGGAASCTDSPQALADCVDEEAYAADLAFVADIRPPGSPHWQAVQDLLADRLEEHGYEVIRDDYGTGVNVIGRRLGTSSPEETVVIGAHYDHISDCRGADDNASGVAAALEIARLLAQADFDRTVLFGFWDEEELGLIGAEAWVGAAVVDQEAIAINFNFDAIGFTSDEPDSQQVPEGFEGVFPEVYDAVEANDFRGDFIALITSEAASGHANALASAADRIGLARHVLEIPGGLENSPAFADLRRSDHAAFWEAEYPAVFLTDTADFRNDHYHCFGGPDVVADIDIPFVTDVTRATVEAAAVALGMN